MSEIVIVNHKGVWGKGQNWFVFHCPKCSTAIYHGTPICPTCKEPLEYQKPKETNHDKTD